MTKARSISFAEFRRFLKGLGFAANRAEAAGILHHPTEGLLVFRLYGDDEAVGEGDLRSTRKFLDLRGLLEGKDFDAFLQAGDRGQGRRVRESGQAQGHPARGGVVRDFRETTASVTWRDG